MKGEGLGMAQVVKCLPRKHKVLNSNLNTKKKNLYDDLIQPESTMILDFSS
jgi:hypothetical protein